MIRPEALGFLSPFVVAPTRFAVAVVVDGSCSAVGEAMSATLAHTTKLLKAVTSLRFANRQTFVIEPSPTWLAKSKLTPNDRKQQAARAWSCRLACGVLAESE